MNPNYKYTYTYNGIPVSTHTINQNILTYKQTVLGDYWEAELAAAAEFPVIEALLRKCCN